VVPRGFQLYDLGPGQVTHTPELIRSRPARRWSRTPRRGDNLCGGHVPRLAFPLLDLAAVP
jgi:hypothetical protein